MKQVVNAGLIVMFLLLVAPSVFAVKSLMSKQINGYSLAEIMSNLIQLNLVAQDGPMNRNFDHSRFLESFKKKLNKSDFDWRENKKLQFNRYKNAKPVDGNQLKEEIEDWCKEITGADLSDLKHNDQITFGHFLSSIAEGYDIQPDWIEFLVEEGYMHQNDLSVLSSLKNENKSIKFVSLRVDIKALVNPCKFEWQ